MKTKAVLHGTMAYYDKHSPITEACAKRLLVAIAVLVFCPAHLVSPSMANPTAELGIHESPTGEDHHPWICSLCNLVILNIDLLRADHVGLIQQGHELTPNIDRFFSHGLIFKNMSASSGATYLSATATATGTEAMFNTHNIWDMKSGGGSWRVPRIIKQDGPLLIDRLPTLAQTLQANGYYTIGINDWIHSGKMVHLDRGFMEFVELPLTGSLFEDQIERVISSLRRKNNSPFHLYFHSSALHFRLYFPADRSYEDPFFREQLRQLGVEKDGAVVLNIRKPGRPVALIWAAYTEQLRYIDEQLGRLFQVLRDSSLDDTIVVLYANHGVDINREGRLGVGLPYRNYLHVPFLIRHPRVRSPIHIETLTSLVDLAPTIYELLGMTSKVPLTTYSMLPLLTGGTYPREFAFSKDIQYESVRDAEWKLVISGGIRHALYDLRADPQEEGDLYDPRSPVARRLRAALIEKRLQQQRYAMEVRKYIQNQ